MKIKVESFEGPLDLLLKLIEAEKLDITKVSLVKVAEQYLDYWETEGDKKPDEMADFLLIAAKLLLIKSRALLPELFGDEEDPAGELERQLKMYKKYLEASREIEHLATANNNIYSRPEYERPVGAEFKIPRALNQHKLQLIMESIVGELAALARLPRKTLAKVISIKEKIAEIRQKIKGRAFLSWSELAGQTQDKTEIIVSFLGILELNKQQSLLIEQEEIFGEIKIKNLNNF